MKTTQKVNKKILSALRGLSYLGVGAVAWSNAMPSAGTSQGGKKTFLAREPWAQRYRVVALDPRTGQVCPAATGKVQDGYRPPLGIAHDSPSAAADPVCVEVFGSNAGTLNVLVGEDLPAGALLTVNDQGQAISLDALKVAGTYAVLGLSLQAGKSGQVIEFTPWPGALRSIS
jgi:hypothetical protein